MSSLKQSILKPSSSIHIRGCVWLLENPTIKLHRLFLFWTCSHDLAQIQLQIKVEKNSATPNVITVMLLQKLPPFRKGRKFFKYLLIDYLNFASLNSKGLLQGSITSWTSLYVVLDVCGFFFFNASHVHMPTGTQTQAAQSPGAKDCLTTARIGCLHRSLLDLSARLHSTDQQLLFTWALPLTVLQRITFLWFSFYALEKSAVLYLFMPLFQDTKEENGPQT